jgi:C-terminal processing protease CtpA/Prc
MGGKRTWACCLALLASGLLFREAQAQQQQMSKFDRARTEEMLKIVASDVSKHYYDRDFHGVDWDAKVQEAKEKIDRETNLGMALSHIAAALDTLNDSHTFFVPPQRPVRARYGWEFEMIGDQCFVTQVQPGSDAETKGLRPGDQVLAINGYTPTRDNLWKMQFVFRILRPQPALKLALRDPAGQERQVEVMTKFRQDQRLKDLTGNGIWDVVRAAENEQHFMRVRTREVGDDLLVVKLPEFLLTRQEVDDLIHRANKRELLIVDLRGNPGGAVETLEFLVGGMFDHEVKVGDQVERDKTKPLNAKSMGGGAFKGKLAVLVDSKSASAAELFARTVQLEKRGLVLGDQSSGSVMESKEYSYKVGDDVVVFFGASITAADLVMTDGKSLEHRGVTPDQIVLPSAADLAAGRDPVLSQAAATLGAKLSPEAAGKLFPYEWPPDTE